MRYSFLFCLCPVLPFLVFYPYIIWVLSLRSYKYFSRVSGPCESGHPGFRSCADAAEKSLERKAPWPTIKRGFAKITVLYSYEGK